MKKGGFFIINVMRVIYNVCLLMIIEFENGGAGLGAVDPARAVRPKPGVWDPDFGHRGGPGGSGGGRGGPKPPILGGGQKSTFFPIFSKKRPKKCLFLPVFFLGGAQRTPLGALNKLGDFPIKIPRNFGEKSSFFGASINSDGLMNDIFALFAVI